MAILRVLLLEDNPDDAVLVTHELKKAGYEVQLVATDTREEFLDQFSEDYDLIISDHELPQFDALEALDLVQKMELDIPFIIVSGTIQEEKAVEAMRRGAADYLLKDRLARLGSAVAQALERRRERREKQQAHADLLRIQKAVESASDAIVITGADGIHIYQNPAADQLTGYSTSEHLEADALTALFVDRELAQIVMDTVGSGRPWSGEATLQRRDGAVIPTSVRVDIINDSDGSSIGIVALFRDVTAQKRYEEQLIRAKMEAQELANMKESFLTTMSHEIRTPLTGILGFAEILESLVSEEGREYAELIHKSGIRLFNTLNSVLDLAQIEAGAATMRLVPVNVSKVIARTVQLTRPQARDAGLSLTTDIRHSVYALADEVAFGRVLTNLLSNAIRFTRKGGISIAVRAHDDVVEIAVRDTGVGIGREFLPHVFDDFKQESTGMGRQFEGTGIGLTIVKRLVELMGGSIAVSSRKGRGSTFTVTLARAESPSETRRSTPAEEKFSKMRVLVVDDDRDTRLVYKKFLSAVHEIDVVASAEEALDLAQQAPYDVILLDINLGGAMSGEDVLHRLRELPASRNTPVLASTAYALQTDRDRFLDAGFDAYLSKPFTRERLLEALDSCAATHRA